MRSSRLLAACLALCCLAGCARYPVNARLAAWDREAGYRFRNLAQPDNSDSLFVVLAFSGGGTRAAALSYGVLEKLRDTTVTWEGRSRRLLDEVDVISSVSGGSFTAAYYALNGERTFSDFEGRFLKRNIERELTLRLLLPSTWLRLLSPTFDRIDMAAEFYDEEIFDRRTFGDLLGSGRRPFILLNATDMTLGARFEFTQEQFDLLCSDLAPFPVARAVAASSAFPVLLSPVTLKNYAGECGYREAAWVVNALRDREVAARRFARATQASSYLDAGQRPFLHLIDGGIADNIGLRGPLNALVSTDAPWSLLRMINQKQVQKVVFIVVNAGTQPDSDLDKHESPPNLDRVITTAINAPMDNYSFETIETLKDKISEFEAEAKARRDCQEVLTGACPQAKLPGTDVPAVRFYPIVLSFDGIKDYNTRKFFKNLPTTFALPADTVDRLRDMGKQLLTDSEEFKALQKDLTGEP